ncbi:MAG: hypothetical protein MJ117_00345 [Lachnospiraceae bacterium]|nr:hypothetical protein [Lachnospiraceae bacterium]
MSISLNAFAEYAPPNIGFPSMKEYFEKEPYEGKEKIIKYLKSGKKTYISLGKSVDFFTNETLPVEMGGMTDGEFSWSTSLYHYVERYNLRLPKEFEDKVLSQ